MGLARKGPSIWGGVLWGICIIAMTKPLGLRQQERYIFCAIHWQNSILAFVLFAFFFFFCFFFFPLFKCKSQQDCKVVHCELLLLLSLSSSSSSLSSHSHIFFFLYFFFPPPLCIWMMMGGRKARRDWKSLEMGRRGGCVGVCVCVNVRRIVCMERAA